MDADQFKNINDTHGHQLGDECLRLVADVMKETCKRPGDVISRYGGDEFAIILPETESPNAYVLAERLRVQIAGAGSDIGLTVSIGVASSLPSGQQDTPETLLNRTDEALYRAKENGRNRTEIQALRRGVTLRAVS
jgi:diguanylate cyclase (GGDEF)-like protein